MQKVAANSSEMAMNGSRIDVVAKVTLEAVKSKTVYQ
jgi:hypothetical protein